MKEWGWKDWSLFILALGLTIWGMVLWFDRW